MWPWNAWTGSGRRQLPGVTDFAAAAHDYALEWLPSAAGRPRLMRWLVDGQPFWEQQLNVSWRSGALPAEQPAPYTQDGQPWDQRFHLILNVAVGGNFFPAAEFGQFGGAAQWDAAAAGWERARLEVEHVKVWAWPG